MVRTLADKLNVHRHLVIAGFVLGFIFVPMLTLLVFLGALYWANDPERLETSFDRVAEKAREKYKAHFSAEPDDTAPDSAVADPVSGRVPVTETEFKLPEFPELRRKFEELEARAGAMEACVASDEFTLNREFRQMGR